MCPLLSRPPVFTSRSVSDLSGRLRVISRKSALSVCRSVGVIGRNFLSAMMAPCLDLLEQIDRLLGHQCDDGLLPVRALAREPAHAAHLAVDELGAHRGHLDLEDFLDRALDVDLVGIAVDLEQVLIPHLTKRRALLGDQGAPNDGSRMPHRTNTSCTRLSAADVSSTASQCSRS